MKGLVLAGGKGTRLRPMTNVVNKHILPVYDKPVIHYPVETLLRSGIDDIITVSTPEDIGRYIQLLEGDFDAEFRYRVQKEPNGIADALSPAEDFVDDEVAVMLGDNIVLDDLESEFEAFADDDADAKIFLKRVERSFRYGIAELNAGAVTGLSEKLDRPESNYAIIGLYLYRKEVFEVIPTLEPSNRGEIEITDINKTFLKRGSLAHSVTESQWFDVGTPEGLFRAAKSIRSQRRQQSSRE